MDQSYQSSSSSNQSSKRIYFSKEDDLALAREVLGQNPYEDSSRWHLIQVNLLQIIGKSVSIRTLKDRVRNMVKKFEERDKKAVFKSGIEEEVNELDDILRCISELIGDLKNKPAKAGQEQENSYQTGFCLRENASKNNGCNILEGPHDNPISVFPFEIGEEIEVSDHVSDSISKSISVQQQQNLGKKEEEDTPKKRKACPASILTPSRKRSGGLKTTTLNYLQKKDDRWFEIRSRELALQERQKLLDEKRFELECFERKKRIELEEEKEKLQAGVLKNQQKLIEAILNKSGVNYSLF